MKIEHKLLTKRQRSVSFVEIGSVTVKLYLRLYINSSPLYVPSAALLVGRSRVPFPVVSLDFSVTYSFRPYHGPGVDSAPSENEYQEHFLGIKAAGA
jgi:hypothetical protein